MINILGVIIIIVGFAEPFLTSLNLSVLFFWIGFLALLSPSKFIPATANWNKWARIGLFTNVCVNGLMFARSEERRVGKECSSRGWP